MSRKRQGMYFSPTDDAQLLQELERCVVRGRKAELLRNYALLGYQHALSLCASSDLDGDHSELTGLLAELFAPDDTPPDFRLAAEFIKARATAQGRGGKSPPAQVAAAAKPAQQEALPPDDAESMPAKAKPKPQWSGLSSLVGSSSKDKEQGGN